MKKECTVQVAFRLPETLLNRLDRHAERLAVANPGLTFTRVDALRTLLARAFELEERRRPIRKVR
jgi:hypothetical protein